MTVQLRRRIAKKTKRGRKGSLPALQQRTLPRNQEPQVDSKHPNNRSHFQAHFSRGSKPHTHTHEHHLTHAATLDTVEYSHHRFWRWNTATYFRAQHRSQQHRTVYGRQKKQEFIATIVRRLRKLSFTATEEGFPRSIDIRNSFFAPCSPKKQRDTFQMFTEPLNNPPPKTQRRITKNAMKSQN